MSDNDIEMAQAESDSSGNELDNKETRGLVQKQNRKNKKSGGFQSMGLSHAVFKVSFPGGFYQ